MPTNHPIVAPINMLNNKQSTKPLNALKDAALGLARKEFNPINQSELNTHSWCYALEKVCKKVMTGFDFISDWLRKCHKIS